MGVFANVSQQSQSPNGSGGVFSRVAQDPRNLAISQGQAVGTQKRYERTGKVGPSFGGQVVRGIVKPFARLGTNAVQAAQIRKNPNAQPFSGNFLGEVKAVGQSGNFGKDILDSIGVGAEIGSNFIGGGGAASAVKAGAKGLIKQGIKTGAKTGFQAGTAYGFGAGLQDQEDKNIGQILGNTAIQTIKGAVAGTATGTALGGVTGLIAKPSALLPKGENIMNRVARLTPRQAQKFKEMSGVSHGQYLKETGNFGTPKEIIEKEAQKFANSMKTADSALETLQGTFKPEPVGTAINDLVEREVRVSAPGAPSQDLERTIFLKKKFMEQGLTMPEINEAKRLYERNIRMDFVKQNLPEGIARATNIDNALRKWQFAKADELGLKNLPEINKQTRLSKFIVDNLGKQINGKVGNNGITLTDWIILSNGDPTAIGAFLTKKAVLNNRIQSRIAKAVSKKPTKGEVKAIFGNKVDEATQTTRKTTPQPKLSPTVSERSYTNTVLPKSSPVNPPANLKAQKIAPPSKIPSKVSISKSLAPKKLPSKPVAKTDSLLQEARKYKSAEELFKGIKEALKRNEYNIEELFPDRVGYKSTMNAEQMLKSAKDNLDRARNKTVREGGTGRPTKEYAESLKFWENSVKEKQDILNKLEENNSLYESTKDNYSNTKVLERLKELKRISEDDYNLLKTFLDYQLENGAITDMSQLTDIWNKANKPKLSLKDNRGFIATGYKNEGNLTTKILKDLEGKTTVSKQYILDATNRGELKQVERDITRQVLEDMTRNKEPLISIPQIKSKYPKLEFGIYENPSEITLSKIVVPKAERGGGVGTSAMNDLIKYADQSGKKIVLTPSTDYGGSSVSRLKDFYKKFGFVENAGKNKDFSTRESMFRLPQKTSSPDTINVKEFADKVKSELLPLKRKTLDKSLYENITLPTELRGNVANYHENLYELPVELSHNTRDPLHFRDINEKMYGWTRVEDMSDGNTRRVIEVQNYLTQKAGKEQIEKELEYFPSLTNEQRIKIEKEGGSITERNAKTRSIQESLRNEKRKITQYGNPESHFRMIREEIKKAAQDGKTKLQFPTGETAMKIEGLGTNEGHWYDNASQLSDAERRTMTITQLNEALPNLKPENLKVGMEVVQGGQGKWIITDVLGDGKFKAVPKREMDRALATSNVDSQTLSKQDQISYLENHRKEVFDYAEQFDISGKVDTNNPIYKFYEKDVQKYLNKFGGKRVIDDKGVSWIEIPITKDMGDAPVEAFGKIGMSPLFVGAGLGLAGVATAGTIKKKSIYKNGK